VSRSTRDAGAERAGPKIESTTRLPFMLAVVTRFTYSRAMRSRLYSPGRQCSVTRIADRSSPSYAAMKCQPGHVHFSVSSSTPTSRPGSARAAGSSRVVPAAIAARTTAAQTPRRRRRITGR
jgi:hypothetical protein